MSPIILDCSVTISWFIPDEFSKNSLDIRNKISEEGAIVPTIWSLEVGNVLLISERRKRITKEQRKIALYTLNELPIKTDELTFENAWFETIELAEKYNLTLYDACYLELSLRCNSLLATFDNNLKEAAKLAGVSLINSLS
jgi:predicted nucleic acid-binding protein